MPSLLLLTLPAVLASDLPVLKVHQAISVCNRLLEPLTIKVEGELASISLSKGKFYFFDIKDEGEEARLSCFMMSFAVSFPLEEGMRVVLHAKPGIYAKNGQFRLTVQRVEPLGEGTRKRAFDLLKEKLQKEGLFDTARKRQLPQYPAVVAVVSSNEAAGYGDFMRIIQARLPVRMILANVAVQGVDAEKNIVDAFTYLNEHIQPEVIVLIRGGGSTEDLHAFNSELVARAIVSSRAPVLVGVGHEKDVTIADYAADVRAATPSNAAQLLLIEKQELIQTVQRRVSACGLRLQRLLQLQRQRVFLSEQRMAQFVRSRVQTTTLRVDKMMTTINSLSPQNTLARGYSIVLDAHGNRLVQQNAEVGSVVSIYMVDGSALATITSTSL